jgi:hypothetical protein
MNGLMNGLWIAHFDAGEAHGKGLAVLHGGEILGGDFAHTWVGSYREEGGNLYARVRVAPYNGHAAAEEHPEQPMTMTLIGSCTELDATLAGHADESDLAVSIEMHKAAGSQ